MQKQAAEQIWLIGYSLLCLFSIAVWQIEQLKTTHIDYFTVSVGQEFMYSLAGFSAQSLQRLQSRCRPGCVLIWGLDSARIHFWAHWGCRQNSFPVAVWPRVLTFSSQSAVVPCYVGFLNVASYFIKPARMKLIWCNLIIGSDVLSSLPYRTD